MYQLIWLTIYLPIYPSIYIYRYMYIYVYTLLCIYVVTLICVYIWAAPPPRGTAARKQLPPWAFAILGLRFSVQDSVSGSSEDSMWFQTPGFHNPRIGPSRRGGFEDRDDFSEKPDLIRSSLNRQHLAWFQARQPASGSACLPPWRSFSENRVLTRTKPQKLGSRIQQTSATQRHVAK